MSNLENKDETMSMIDVFVKEMILQVQNDNTKKYIKNRILPQIKWYSIQSAENKHKYYFWMTVSIILGVLISLMSILTNGSILMKLVIALLGASVTASNAFISLHSFRDLWIVYRRTHDALTRILYCYFNNAGIFSQCSTQDKKDELLVNVCEEEISQESGDWSIILKK